MAVRKNALTLSAAEKSAFVQAVKALKANGTYDQYVLWHVQAMAQGTPPGTPPSIRNAAHRGPAFFPWHREFLRRLELDLQNVSGDPNMGLPYWDWATDAALPNPATSAVWGNDLMGGDGNPVTTGPFASGMWTIINGLGNPAGALIRAFGLNTPTLPTQADVTGALNEVPYDSSPWNTSSNPSFRNRSEGWMSGLQLHNRVHVWVGGSMLAGTSPNDPIFFLHHCFVDKMWADWQAQNPGQGYVPAGGGPAGHNLNDALFPWTATPADVVNHHALGYQYDDEPIVAAGGVVNAASFLAGAVSPGVILSIFGSNLGPAAPQTLTIGPGGLVTTQLAQTRVLFGGQPAPLLLVSEGQINVVAPYGLAGASGTQVEVEVDSVLSAAVSLPVSPAGPGVFALTQTGSGQGAVLNQDNSVNDASNPAPTGSVVQIFATGGGVTSPSAVDGGIAPTPPPLHQLTETVQADIGGLNASVLFAGAAPGLVFGVVQVNAEVPATVAAGNAVPLELTIGGVTSQTVTIAVS
ncbi:MAG: tyrosinase family protein [Gemmatimonadetes bacterium]|nr:tyrosinase family protein [Gemmatimonadota bacterium]